MILVEEWFKNSLTASISWPLFSYKEINAENVIEVVKDAMDLYRENANDCEFLLNYASGEQPIKRKSEKKVMEWIDCEVIDNVALEVSDFWRGFGWGNPITLVLRGDTKDAESKAEGIAALNYNYAATGNSVVMVDEQCRV